MKTHEQKLARIDALMTELNTLGSEVDEYEREHFPIPLPTLAEAMRFRREQMGETVEEIAARAGLTASMWEMMERGGMPNLNGMRKLRTVGIPASVLLP